MGSYRKPPKPVNKALTPIEQRFMVAYLTYLEVKAAAEEAQVAMKTANAIMNRPHVKAQIEYELGMIIVERRVQASRVVQELAGLAYSNIFDVIEIQEDGQTILIKDMRDIPVTVQSAIKSISTVPNKFGMAMKVEFHDKMTPLRMLAQLTGVEHEKGKPQNPEKDYDNYNPDQLQELANKLAQDQRKAVGANNIVPLQIKAEVVIDD